MKFFAKVLGLFLMLSSVSALGQDTVAVYFDFSESKVTALGREVLNALPTEYDLSDLDSVLYVGMADSSGSFEHNLKLSRKRAQNVADYCEDIFPNNLPQRITAKGETLSSKPKESRRVDVILFFRPLPTDEKEVIAQTQNLPDCFEVDYALLHRSHFRTVTKRGREYVIIETSKADVKKKRNTFYGTENLEGEFGIKKIRWSSKTTGNKWWKERRFVATLPKVDYDKYKIFTTGDAPCDTCSEDFTDGLGNGKIRNEGECLQLDRFLMNNLQIKVAFFNPDYVEVRVPREYVNLDYQYHIGCSAETKLEWKALSGRRHQNYYYTRLPRTFNRIHNITRVMECCEADPEPSECDKDIINCSTLMGSDPAYILQLELGSHFQNAEAKPYAALSLSKDLVSSRFHFLVGTDIDWSFYSSLRYQEHLISFPYNSLNPFEEWKKPSEIKPISSYARIYAGTELKTRLHSEQTSYLEQNVHLGFASVNRRPGALIPRIFIQYGIGGDYLGNYDSGLYSIVQVGIDVKLARFSSKN